MTIKLFPYKQGSASCKALAEALGIKRVKLQGGVWRGRQGDFLINWGSSSPQVRQVAGGATILNSPEAIKVSGNKLASFKALKEAGVSVPEFKETREGLEDWLGGTKKIVCRTTLTGHSGQGIVIAETLDQVVDAPLYVKYIPKEHEYRVHVMKGEVFFVQRKARKLDVPDDQVNWKVRNLDGGFIYANQAVECPDEVKEQAKKATEALGLDFGAVDVIVKRNQEVYVLEVNTACGLSGTTLDRYVEALKQHTGG